MMFPRIDRVPGAQFCHQNELEKTPTSMHVLGTQEGLVPAEGFEPPTYGLQNRCTTTVLSRHVCDRASRSSSQGAFYRAPPPCTQEPPSPCTIGVGSLREDRGRHDTNANCLRRSGQRRLAALPPGRS